MDSPIEPVEPASSPTHLAGSMVRGVVLVLLVVVVAPTVIVNGDRLAAPVVALMVLAEIVIAIAALTYWLVTVGAPAPWLVRRLHLTPDRVLIAASTAVVAGAAVTLAWFRTELSNVRSPLAQFDLRAAATATRLVGERDLMQTLNRAGVRSMLLLGLMLVLAAVAAGAFRSAALLASTMAVSGGLAEVLKISQLPLLASLGHLDTYPTQWPSGHASFQGSLALGMVLWWWAAGLPRPSLAAAVLVPFGILVGYSRAFLGIHLLSEVLSGWLVALVAASFVLAVDRLIVPRLSLRAPSRPWLAIVAGVAALMITAFAANSVHRFGDRGPGDFGGFAPQHFPRNFNPRGFPTFGNSTTPPQPTQLASDAPSAVLAPIARFSETLLGSHAQPVGLVVIGNEAPLRAAIKQEGWTEGAESTPEDIAPTFGRGLTGGSDPNSLLAPTFLDTRSPDLVLRRKATDASGTNEAQVWHLPLETPNRCGVWAITTARDVGTKWTWPALYPEHRIAPDIDTEREALADALVVNGFVDLGRFQFVKAMHGTGPTGSFVTDGKVAVVRQSGCG